jgi:hypothetical protein
VTLVSESEGKMAAAPQGAIVVENTEMDLMVNE